MFQWVQDHPAIVWIFVLASIVIFLATAVIMPALVVRIRADYFTHARRPPSLWSDQHPAVRIVLQLAKNVLACVFVLAGLAMLVLPGQGLLTLIIGFLLLDFPGKYRFEKLLIRRRFIHRPINWLRRRAGREPLKIAAGRASGV